MFASTGGGPPLVVGLCTAFHIFVHGMSVGIDVRRWCVLMGVMVLVSLGGSRCILVSF